MISVAFDLDDERIARLNGANVHSLKELQKVLAAVDLQARVELREPIMPPRPGALSPQDLRPAKPKA